jgi:hypothetical protein
MLRNSGGPEVETWARDSESRKSFLAPVPTVGDHADEISQKIEWSGNFSLSCDIKEA